MTDKQFDIYRRVFNAGHKIGCHQMPERSFFYGNWQFPVCARCTGVLLGQLLMPAFLATGFRSKLIMDITCLAIMFLDWLAQYLGVLQSTNRRRLITGLIAGAALTAIYFKILWQAVLWLTATRK